jgi:hypothetical protein
MQTSTKLREFVVGQWDAWIRLLKPSDGEMCSGFFWGGFLCFWYLQKKRLRHQSVARPKHKLGGEMTALDVTQKTEVYETLSSLNMAFAGIVQHLQTLQKTGLFNSKAAKLFPSFARTASRI